MGFDLKEMDPSMDPSMTVDVNNDKLEALIAKYTQTRSLEDLNSLVNCIHDCRVLMPANVDENKKPLPIMMKNEAGDTYVPIYTSRQHIPEDQKSPAIVNVPYIAANYIADSSSSETMGIVINPFTQNLIFKTELVKRITEVDNEKAKMAKEKQVIHKQMTEPQYNYFERRQFERIQLPREFFAKGEAFMEKLADGKEAVVDEFFENCYQKKRLYPYLTEEFSVMVMNISEAMKIIRVDMPEQNMDKELARRVYMFLDKANNRSRYYLITASDMGQALMEVTSEGEQIHHGPAPVEGAELQALIDMVNESDVIAS